MNLDYEIARERPLAWWTLAESTGNSVDKTGGGKSLVHTNTPTRSQLGLYRQGTAMLYSGTQHSVAQFTTALTNGREHVPFALEVMVRNASAVTARRLLIGRPTAGLFITPTGFEFYIETSTGNYTAKYEIGEFNRAYHLVGNYMDGGLTIVVNGEHGTPVSISGTINDTSANFYVGGTATTSATSVFLGPAVIHRQILGGTVIQRHIRAAWETIPEELVQQHYGAVAYELTDIWGSIGAEFNDSVERLDLGSSDEIVASGSNMTIPDDAISPGIRWSEPIPIEALGVIDGSRIDWDASPTGVTVEASLDNTTWTACTNHATIPGLAEGVNTVGKSLFLRYTLNVQTPAPWIRSVRAVVYNSKNPRSNMPNWTLTAVENFHMAQRNASVVTEDDGAAARLRKPGRLLVPAPTGIQLRTVELWVRKVTNGTAWEYIFDGRNAADGSGNVWLAYDGAGAYNVGGGVQLCVVNGVQRTPVPADFSPYRYTHIVLTTAAPITWQTVIGARYNQIEQSDLDIQTIALYGEPLDLNGARKNYRIARGYTVAQVTHPMGTITEQTGKVYKYPWAVEIAAG